MEKTRMLSLCAKLYGLAKLVNLVKQESGQDLIEYALVVALVALGATAGMQSLAQGVNAAFTSIATTVNNAI